MLGATEYTCAIDIWSMGCVMGEFLTGRPLFCGETSVDQLVKVIQLLGAPTRAQMQAMNQQYANFHFPDLRPRDISQTIPNPEGRIPQSAYDLLTAMLNFVPNERIEPYEVSLKLDKKPCFLPPQRTHVCDSLPFDFVTV